VSSEETLNPFWRPCGFWDGFDDSDDDALHVVLPIGGDTSNEPAPLEQEPKKKSWRQRLLKLTKRTGDDKDSAAKREGGEQRRRWWQGKPAVTPPPAAIMAIVTRETANKKY
jgi:hypothetical protein